MNYEKGVEAANKSKNEFGQCIKDTELYYISENKRCQVYLEFYSIGNIPQTLFRWCFQLMEKNMKEHYQKSEDGWNRNFKLKEMRESKTRFIIVKTMDKEIPVGFISFQFDFEFEKQEIIEDESLSDIDACSFLSQDLEDYREVVYCYELHVMEGYRNLGLGQFLLNILFKLAIFWKIPYVMLTVFKSNLKAMSFYKKQGFVIDSSSPTNTTQKKYDYEILSYFINKKITTPPNERPKHKRNQSSLSFASLSWT